MNVQLTRLDVFLKKILKEDLQWYFPHEKYISIFSSRHIVEKKKERKKRIEARISNRTTARRRRKGSAFALSFLHLGTRRPAAGHTVARCTESRVHRDG